MDYFSLGSEISYPDYNALVYLLRKFKRLTSDLRLGSSTISSDYGTYSVTGGLTSVGGNFILEDNVTISSNDVLLNCFYTFYFTVVDVNLSGTVNRRVISVTGDTGDNGVLEVTLSPDLLESDEVILPDFKVDIVFDPHEYYTPVSGLNIELEVDKLYIDVGETNTITATVIDDSGDPISGLNLGFNINGNVERDITDSDGIASITYTGVSDGWVNVTVSGESIRFYVGEVTIAEVSQSSLKLGRNSNGDKVWLISNDDVIIDWGDGTTSTVNNPTRELGHLYTDGESTHNIKFIGNVTALGDNCFFYAGELTSIYLPDTITSIGRNCFSNCTNLTSITIPDSVTTLEVSCFTASGLTSIIIPDSVISLGNGCFYYCTGLTSVTIPNSVTSIGYNCFGLCSALVDYELYWTGNSIITYDSSKMPNNTNTIFTIPSGETANYTAKGYPTSKLVERGESLTLTADKSIIQKTETSTITATLKQSGSPLTGKTLNYQVKHGSTVISSGTKTTNSSGQATISYTGTGVGDVSVIVSYGSLLQETYGIYDCLFADDGISGDGIYERIRSELQVTNTGSIISATSNYAHTFFKSQSTRFSVDFRVEFDLLESESGVRLDINETSDNWIQLNNTGHYIINITSNGITATRDGNTITTPSLTPSSPIRLSFYISNTGQSMKFKNLKVYSI